jgi:hypothetical protein
MQLIAEAYDILKRGLGLTEDEIAEIFGTWNKGVLDSFLIEITTNILKYKDEDGEYVVNKILDSAGQKGTGKWTAIAALDAGTAGWCSSTGYLANLTIIGSTLVQSHSSAKQCSLVASLPSRRSVCVLARQLLARRKSPSVVTRSSSSMILSRHCTPQRLFPILKASCS